MQLVDQPETFSFSCIFYSNSLSFAFDIHLESADMPTTFIFHRILTMDSYLVCSIFLWILDSQLQELLRSLECSILDLSSGFDLVPQPIILELLPVNSLSMN